MWSEYKLTSNNIQGQSIALLMLFFPFVELFEKTWKYIWLNNSMVTLYWMNRTCSLWTGAATWWHLLKSITWQNHLYKWLRWIHRLQYQNYLWTSVWSHLWTDPMLETPSGIHNQLNFSILSYSCSHLSQGRFIPYVLHFSKSGPSKAFDKISRFLRLQGF